MQVNGIKEEITGILFDMDGLLVNSEHLYWQANIQAAKEENLHTPDDTYLKLAGASEQVMQNFYHHYFKDKAQVDHFIARTNEIVWQWADEGKLQLQPGVQAALDQFQQLALPMALVSSNSEKVVEHVMWVTGIRNYFCFHVSLVDVKENNLRSKPAPDIYLLAAKKMNIAKENILAFEDSSSGVQAAKAAGIKCVMIPDLLPPTELDWQNAVMVCKNFCDFLGKI
ncbi:HAD family phosphatase [Lactobacillus sp. ESL0791]|uniref:HAD family hydrolase n=1 Tax=Lactobacillus sp. ESL0791 TaxID=2983234 RepID=UPI0023F91E5C|nr:HAD family phosphatase [Lactobacillus sp. ESL0791]MDF7638795.1 HAD family phosphatase [Lactobacillus sp. ESL0791]